jgi:hypothetical protein
MWTCFHISQILTAEFVFGTMTCTRIGNVPIHKKTFITKTNELFFTMMLQCNCVSTI